MRTRAAGAAARPPPAPWWFAPPSPATRLARVTHAMLAGRCASGSLQGMRNLMASALVCNLLLAGCGTSNDPAPNDDQSGGSGGAAESGGTGGHATSGGKSGQTGSGGKSSAGGASGEGGNGGTSAGGNGGTSAGGNGGTSAGGSGGTSAGGSGGSDGNAPDAGAPDTGGGGAVGGSGDVPPGMTKLFDGTTLMGWDGNPAFWSVKEGAIDGTAQNGGQLIMTKDDYDDFRFIVASRRVSTMNHLGICFWGGRTPVWKYNGCKLLIPPGGGSWDYAGSGGLPGLTPYPHPAVDQQQWHVTELLAHLKTGTVEMAVNGVHVLTYKEPNLARLKKGPIGLQIHAKASQVQYKDVFVEVNPAVDKLLTVKGM